MSELRSWQTYGRMNTFCRYQLRTTDVDSAHAFYADLFGADFWRDGIEVQSLPAAAAARGAPPHWLGHIHVEDVVGAMLRFVMRRPRQMAALFRTALDARAARATLMRGRQLLGPGLGLPHLQRA